MFHIFFLLPQASVQWITAQKSRLPNLVQNFVANFSPPPKNATVLLKVAELLLSSLNKRLAVVFGSDVETTLPHQAIRTGANKLVFALCPEFLCDRAHLLLHVVFEVLHRCITATRAAIGFCRGCNSQDPCEPDCVLASQANEVRKLMQLTVDVFFQCNVPSILCHYVEAKMRCLGVDWQQCPANTVQQMAEGYPSA